MNATTDGNVPCNTAVFYDVENLTKGYGFSKKIAEGLSLRSIIKKLEETGRTGRIVMNKAYANWFNPHLSFLHSEIVDLDIDPVTVTGYYGSVLKNVADIRLAIDVMETLKVHPEISTYVIVSGDGAYASLARKLHEHCKVVIGCAYKQSTNKHFAETCDLFIWIEDPEDKHDTEVQSSAPSHIQPNYIKNVTESSSCENPLLTQVIDLLNKFASTEEYRKSLEIGLNPSVIREFIGSAIKDFNPTTLGYPRFIDLLAEAIESTEMSIYLIPPTAIKVGLKSGKPQNGVMLSKGNIKRFGHEEMVEVRDQRIRRMCREIKPISTNASTKDVVEKLKEIIEWIKNDEEFNSSLSSGINPSTIDCAFREIVIGFNSSRLGFSRFSELLCWITWDTELCLAQNQVNKSVWKFILRSSVPNNYKIYESKLLPQPDTEESQATEQAAEAEKEAPKPPHVHTKEPANIFRQFSDLFKLKH